MTTALREEKLCLLKGLLLANRLDGVRYAVEVRSICASLLAATDVGIERHLPPRLMTLATLAELGRRSGSKNELDNLQWFISTRSPGLQSDIFTQLQGMVQQVLALEPYGHVHLRGDDLLNHLDALRQPLAAIVSRSLPILGIGNLRAADRAFLDSPLRDVLRRYGLSPRLISDAYPTGSIALWVGDARRVRGPWVFDPAAQLCLPEEVALWRQDAECYLIVPRGLARKTLRMLNSPEKADVARKGYLRWRSRWWRGGKLAPDAPYYLGREMTGEADFEAQRISAGNLGLPPAFALKDLLLSDAEEDCLTPNSGESPNACEPDNHDLDDEFQAGDLLFDAYDMARSDEEGWFYSDDE